jgi:hypothetical protein
MGVRVSFSGKDSMVRSGNLRFGTMRIYSKGGQRFGRRNGKMV